MLFASSTSTVQNPVCASSALMQRGAGTKHTLEHWQIKLHH